MCGRAERVGRIGLDGFEIGGRLQNADPGPILKGRPVPADFRPIKADS
jgi:hypothetical protein